MRGHRLLLRWLMWEIGYWCALLALDLFSEFALAAYNTVQVCRTHQAPIAKALDEC